MIKTTLFGVVLFLLVAIVPASDKSSAQEYLTATDIHGFEMVYVPAGSFEMGEDLETITQLYIELGKIIRVPTHESMGILDTHQVEMFGYWIDKYEVTVEQYQSSTCVMFEFCTDASLLVEAQYLADPNKPIVGVSWYDAMRFCNRRQARLPSEVEWEYAASGPENLIFPWGNELVEDNILTYASTSDEIMYPVGSLSGNVSWVGAFDMAGNAAEWVEDRFVPTTQAEFEIVLEYDFLDYRRVYRGGSYIGNLTQVTTYERQTYNPIYGNLEVGFRCARTSDPRKDQ